MHIESQVEAAEVETETFATCAPFSHFHFHPRRFSDRFVPYKQHRGNRRRRSLSANHRCYSGDLGGSLITLNARTRFT